MWIVCCATFAERLLAAGGGDTGPALHSALIKLIPARPADHTHNSDRITWPARTAGSFRTNPRVNQEFLLALQCHTGLVNQFSTVLRASEVLGKRVRVAATPGGALARTGQAGPVARVTTLLYLSCC